MSRTPTDALLSLQRFFAEFLDSPWEIVVAYDASDPPERPFALIEQADEETTPARSAATQEIVTPMTVNLYPLAGATRRESEDTARALRELVWGRVKWGAPPYHRLTTDRIPLYDYTGRDESQRLWIRYASGGAYKLARGAEVSAAIPWNATADAIRAAVEALPSIGEGNLAVEKRAEGIFDLTYIGARAKASQPTLAVTESTLSGMVLGVAAWASVRTLLDGAAPPVRGASDYMRVTSFAQNTIRDDDEPKNVMVAVDLRLTFAVGPPVPLGQMILRELDVDDPVPR